VSKIRGIRCKTPNDVLVVKRRQDFEAICELLQDGVKFGGCGHPHIVVCGDMWFSRGDQAADIRYRERLLNDFARFVRKTTGPGHPAYPHAVSIEHMTKMFLERNPRL
jgi:hypothetical protein